MKVARPGRPLVLLSLLAVCGCGETAPGWPREAGSGGGRPPAASRPVNRAGNRALYGLTFGPYLEGQAPGTVIGPRQLAERLDVLRRRARWVRIYGSTGGLEQAPRIARKLGFRVAAGAWIDRAQTPSAREQELANLEANVRAGWVDLAIVGNEVVHRGDMSPRELAALVRAFRRRVGSAIPVATAETVHSLEEHPVLADCSDVVLAHIYPFWQGVPVEDAVAVLHRQHRALHRQTGKVVVVAETGWPSAGVGPGRGGGGAALASPANAARYLREVSDWAETNGVRVFYMEAFDEAWKVGQEGSARAHWGLFDQAGRLKPGMEAAFARRPVRDTWTRQLPGKPGLTLTDAGKAGDPRAGARGRAAGVSPARTSVQVFIRVGGRWWPKPFATRPLTALNPDGTFTCPLVTHPNDMWADAVRAYLVTEDYSAGLELPPAPPTATVLALAEVVRR